MNFCKYKDLIGKPREGIHAARIPYVDLAFNDIGITVFGSIILAILFGWHPFNTVVVVFLLGILIHRLFCVRTTIDKLLFYESH